MNLPLSDCRQCFWCSFDAEEHHDCICYNSKSPHAYTPVSLIPGQTCEEHEYEEPFVPYWSSKPGNTIISVLGKTDRTVAELAGLMGIDDDRLEGIVLGEAPITEEIAEGLQNHLGASKEFWLTRQRQYDESIEQLKADKA